MADNVREQLREKVVESLRSQGFRVSKGLVSPPTQLSKERIRELHAVAVSHRIEQARAGLERHEEDLLQFIANGDEVIPEAISPRLVEIQPGTEHELLFRYAKLHWSIPVSAGYGRRLRFLVVDESNDKLIGVIGLGDPVFGLAARDEWVGWTASDRKMRLRNVMDAFVLGAVPPYAYLLGGKLVAMLVTSDTVRKAFKRKYGGTRSVIADRKHDGRLALVTTTSALGRSSIYNRLQLNGRKLYQSVGFTKGSGEFHFANGLYQAITDFATENCEPTAKKGPWGIGFRNRREVIRKALPELGLSSDFVYHGIEREVFVVPMASNTKAFLRGDSERVRWHHHSEDELADYFRQRWLLPRAHRDTRYALFDHRTYLLWGSK